MAEEMKEATRPPSILDDEKSRLENNMESLWSMIWAMKARLESLLGPEKEGLTEPCDSEVEIARSDLVMFLRGRNADLRRASDTLHRLLDRLET